MWKQRTLWEEYKDQIEAGHSLHCWNLALPGSCLQHEMRSRIRKMQTSLIEVSALFKNIEHAIFSLHILKRGGGRQGTQAFLTPAELHNTSHRQVWSAVITQGRLQEPVEGKRTSGDLVLTSSQVWTGKRERKICDRWANTYIKLKMSRRRRPWRPVSSC